MRRLIAALSVAAAAACARQSFPPGGPPRNIPPQVMLVFPESGSVNVKAKTVDISFDEVVAERPSGGGQSLSDIVIISPRDGIPRVAWHRTHIEIRGRKGWRDNTAYTVVLRPGIVDLHGNVLKHSTTTIFSTGATVPTNVIRGVVFDYSTGKPVVNALVQAYLPPDSLQYITISDSSGRFELGTLPAGPMTVRGTQDLNNNHALDVREPWDTVHITLSDSATVELYAFIHDSLGPHLSEVTAVDSLHLHAVFDKLLDPATTVDTSNFELRANSDSSIVPIIGVLNWADVQRSRQDSIARADSIAGKKDTSKLVRRGQYPGVRRDTTPQLPLPKPSRPVPPKEFQIALGKPLVVGAFYRLQAKNVRNILGDTATSLHSAQLPKPLPPPPPKPGAAPKPGAKPDTTAKPPAPATPAVLPPPPPPAPKPPQ